jgi:hypothetical protein
MRRREFIAGLGSAATWPVVARAQQGERVGRVGVLMGAAITRTDSSQNAGRDHLETVGDVIPE